MNKIHKKYEQYTVRYSKRTTFYHLIIKRYFDDFTKEFDIFGGRGEVIEELDSEQQYDFFIIVKK